MINKEKENKKGRRKLVSMGDRSLFNTQLTRVRQQDAYSSKFMCYSSRHCLEYPKSTNSGFHRLKTIPNTHITKNKPLNSILESKSIEQLYKEKKSPKPEMVRTHFKNILDSHESRLPLGVFRPPKP